MVPAPLRRGPSRSLIAQCRPSAVVLAEEESEKPQCGAFDVEMVRLKAGDYLIGDEVLVERKTAADFAASLADRRLSRRPLD
jgi:hypothetical protein